MLGMVRSAIARTRGFVAALSSAVASKRRERTADRRRRTSARPLSRLTTGLVAGLALALAAPSAFAMSSGCAAVNGYSGVFTIDGAGNVTDKWTEGLSIANGEVITYSWSGNTNHAYVNVLFSRNGGTAYAAESLQDATAVSGSGSFTITGTGAGDFIEVGLYNYPLTTFETNPALNNSSATINVSCSAPPPAPVASSFTYGSIVAYNDGGNLPTTLSVAGQVTNNPTNYAVTSSTTAQGGDVGIDSSGTATYVPPVGFRGNDSFTYNATNAGGTSSNATVTISVGNPSFAIASALPNGVTGVAYSQQASLTGGKAPYSTFFASGLPAGLSMNASGLITGTPTQTGTFNLSITAKDSSTGTGPYTGSAAATLTVVSGANLQAAWQSSPSSVTAGQTSSFTVQVTNVGTGSAASVTAQIALPTQVTFTSLTTPAGWSCITPAVGATGTVSCTKASVGAGAFEMFTLTVGAPASASPATASMTLNLTSDTEAETATKTFSVLAPDMQASLTGPASVQKGQAATLTLTMTNAGTATTPHASWQISLPAGLTFTSLSTPGGWSCTTPAVGAGGTASCGQPSGIAAGASQVFTLVAAVGAGAASNTTVSAMALTSFESEFPSASFSVTEAAPTVTSISPASGSTVGGTTVNIVGTDFTGATGVTFGGAPANGYTVESATLITATAPAGTGTVDVRVTTAGGTSAVSAADQYTYVSPPVLSSLSPTAGPAGGGNTLVLTGQHLSTVSFVYFNGVAVGGFTIDSDTQITVPSVPAGAAGTTKSVMVWSPYGSDFRSYAYQAAPTVTGVSPTAGPTAGGTTVVITGTGFAAASPTGAVKFGAASASYTVNSDTQITATSPANSAGTYDITVTTAGGTSATSGADQYTYVAPPTVTSISPPVGPTSGGATVTITGSGFAFANATGAVKFGAATATYTINSNTQITATAPANSAGTYDITVTTMGGTSATSGADQFTYVAEPVVSAVSPNTGPTSGGTSVVITGTGLSMTGMVTFGGVTATFTVDSDGQITATTPTNAAGAVNVTVTGPGGSSTLPSGFTYFVPVVSLPASLPGGAIGQAYSGSVAAAHAAGYNVTSGSLAPGLTLNSSTGQITGTPTGAGNWNFMVTAGGEPGWTGTSQAYTLSIGAPTLSLSPASLANGTVGAAYSATVSASGGTAPYAYEVTAGAVPPGLELNDTTGELSGTPIAGGTFNFTVRVADASVGTGAPFTFSGDYTVVIAAPTIVVTPASVPSATATAAYSQTLTATGGTPGHTWAVTAGALPPGLTLSEGGVLSGTPILAGNFNFTATATDSSSGTRYSGSRAYTLAVSAPTVTVSPGALPDARAGSAYSQTLSADGAQGPYTFHVTAGALPAGLTLSEGGVLSGTPNQVGTYNLTVTATDATAGGGFAGSRAYTLTVGSPVFDLQPASLPNGQQGASYSFTLVASGGTAPYTYTAGPGLPAGVALGTDGVISGTPTQSGTFAFTVIARDSTGGPGAPYGVGRGYTWTVDVAAPPTAAGTSVNVAYGSAGTAIDLTAKVAGVASSIAVATAPEHGTVSVSGYVVTYTPAAGYFGTDGFTYTATGPGGTSAPATVSLTVAVPPAPTTANASAAVGFNSAGQAIDLSGSVTGVYSSIAVAQAPAHGTVSVSGAVVTYTPNAGHYGADSFTYTATGPGGTSAPATVSLTVANPPPPNPTPPTGPAQVVAGGDVGVTITNTGGLATGVQITTPPAHGTVRVDTAAAPASAIQRAAAVAPAFVLTYTPNPGYSGPDSFAYALVGPGGTSQPQTVQVTVLPSVTLQPIEVGTLQGVPVQVDVTAGATGGPFTGAAVVSVGPNTAGTASFAQVGASRVMTFTPADDFTGVAVVTYTVSNANGASAPSTVTVTVQARPNPALDADVRGLIGAQVQAAQRFVDTQVQNFSQRNEQLHGQGGQEGPRKHALNLSFGFGDYAGGRPEDPASEIRRREMPERPFADQARKLDELALAAADADASPGGLGPIGGGKVALWSAGSIDFGQRHADAGGSKLKFTTSGVSLGADIEVADGLFVGVGAGYGYDAADIGSEGTRNASRSYMGAIYGSWRIAPQLYLDGVAGLGELSFDSRRIAANDATVIGRRDGSQAFGSVSLAFDHQDGPMTISSYGRLTVSKAELDAFTETGDPVYALAYDAQDVDATFGTLGVRGQWAHAMEDGSFTPRVRAEWRRQLSGADAALVRYADFLTGPSYQIDPLAQSQNTLLLGVGGDWRWDEGLALSLDYEGQVGDETLSHRVTLKVSTRF